MNGLWNELSAVMNWFWKYPSFSLLIKRIKLQIICDIFKCNSTNESVSVVILLYNRFKGFHLATKAVKQNCKQLLFIADVERFKTDDYKSRLNHNNLWCHICEMKSTNWILFLRERERERKFRNYRRNTWI